ncbi:MULTISPECIES: hypothetical protein [unclassified Corallococcus]|uniref:hypothetical protein n=1 Tax=unclassified Corallococcus TaxID=2685029 RepID=UPI001CBAFAD7|nr:MULTISPECIES: hypothetical protein [unclassified Corallococcus]MBZ4334925.1 hypothetical protein [Corallococcus sp. AS-1-12]MBZ4376440.1 hypothetical protein [Corallococcus sp. AS-1-6]
MKQFVEHCPDALQMLPAPQLVPAATSPSAGHCALLPVQYSTASHASAAPRHTVAGDWKLQANVDRAGSHTWHEPSGLAAPAGYSAPSIQQPEVHCAEASHTPSSPQAVPTVSVGCRHEPDASQTSVVQGLPSSTHAVPSGAGA